MVTGRNQEKSSVPSPLHCPRDLFTATWLHQFGLTLCLTLQSSLEIFPGLPLCFREISPMLSDTGSQVGPASNSTLWNATVSSEALEKIYNFGCLFSDNEGFGGREGCCFLLLIVDHLGLYYNIIAKSWFICLCYFLSLSLSLSLKLSISRSLSFPSN